MTSTPVAFLAAAALVTAGLSSAQDFTPDPGQVRLEVSDLRRLAAVLRAAGGETSARAAAIERDYLARASPGLRRYVAQYNVTGASIAAAVAKSPHAYADLDRTAAAILAEAPALRSACQKLKALHPDAVFPPVWFVGGHLGAGGMVEREGVIVAGERYAANPADVVALVLHELAHFQSAMLIGVETYHRALGSEATLLSRAVREGSAELIAELTTGRHINPAAERYGAHHERELWERFRQEMHRREPGDWMFVQPSNAEWPRDLGYWIGYRIAKSYYDSARDKARAIEDILSVTDFAAFLEASGYAGGTR
ncbi:MAG TPA: DUF2268 domain-containing putative Zn-dependent protease [Vicinamibacterales bacterium]|nr:DUF2268 domain-containing putative Zn-dependent protease [Vicinamibacterales bacterium]